MLTNFYKTSSLSYLTSVKRFDCAKDNDSPIYPSAKLHSYVKKSVTMSHITNNC